MDDSRINTLKEIRDWFVNGKKQKVGPMEWISPQCQFDLILSINGFLGILEFILKKYPGDSSTQTLKSYGHTLNKYQITALISSEIKSVNYGIANSMGTGIASLMRRDYRKNKKHYEEDKENNNICQKYNTRLLQLSTFSCGIFESLLTDNLIMGSFKSLSESSNDSVNFLLYLDSIDKLLQSWQNIIKKITCEAIPKKPVIEHTFRKKAIKKDQTADCNLIPENIIVLEPIEASKFFYIVDWVVYKLTKSDKQTKSHPQFKAICAHSEILNSEQVVYKQDVRSQITNVIPDQQVLICKPATNERHEFNDLIPEKGTSSLRENLKTLRKDTQTISRKENKPTLIKKENIPQNPLLGLG
ncbi:hypothetical protein GLOIN_2v1541965 [Rhizophagus irregularis DAOM 181602=DAOM 197198]|nr:hypothetical protein GLOIN_2v1541965 [Rhizophagus irregularis DAOM 181602=DAOM 197198]